MLFDTRARRSRGAGLSRGLGAGLPDAGFRLAVAFFEAMAGLHPTHGSEARPSRQAPQAGGIGEQLPNWQLPPGHWASTAHPDVAGIDEQLPNWQLPPGQSESKEQLFEEVVSGGIGEQVPNWQLPKPHCESVMHCCSESARANDPHIPPEHATRKTANTPSNRCRRIVRASFNVQPRRAVEVKRLEKGHGSRALESARRA